MSGNVLSISFNELSRSWFNFIGINPQIAEHLWQFGSIELTLFGQCMQSGVNDTLCIDFEVPTEHGTCVAAAETIGPENGILAWNPLTNLVSDHANIIAG